MLEVITANMSDKEKEILVNQRDVHGITPVYLSLQRWVKPTLFLRSLCPPVCCFIGSATSCSFPSLLQSSALVA